MSVIVLLIFASLVIGLIFLGAFIWSVRSGQFEDTLTPSLRVLAEDDFTRSGGKAVPVPILEQNKRRQPTENK
jgi:cbb3-type cytochrome oxidase maturation protein